MKIKWLHLSDIHFNYINYESKQVRKDFLKAIVSLREAEAFTHLFLSGDILHQYKKANASTVDFIKDIIKEMGISEERVFMVPGNHDHDRSCATGLVFSSAEKSKITAIDNIDGDIKKSLLRAFSEYDSVYQKIFGKSYYSNYDNPHQIVFDRELTVIKINTAWLEENSEDKNIYCGSNDLLNLLDDNEEILMSGINIAVGHHPMEALAGEERERILDLFKRYNIGIYFCGHQHTPSIQHFCEGNVIQLTCPGGYNDGYSQGGYVWGILDTDCSLYKAEVYIWDNNKWCIESRLRGTDERGIYYFDSKKYKHNSQIAAIDIKLFDGHIARQEIEDSIGCSDFDIHTYNTVDILNEGYAEKFSRDIEYLIEKNNKVHIYPLAPIPLLIKLGFELQNNSKIIIHQYDRHNNKWVYDKDENMTLEINRNIVGKESLAVIISTSACIDETLIKSTLADCDYDVIEFKSSQIELGLPLYNRSIVSFAKKISDALNEIVLKYETIHIFAAVPAGLAMEIGRNLLTSMYHNVYTYNLRGNKYERAFVLNPIAKSVSKENKKHKSNIVVDANISRDLVYLPIMGKVACGDLSEAILESDESFPISSTVLGSGDYFVLIASGDSMINAGIDDGDLVIVRVQNIADNGQIVLARVDNEVTLKRLIKDDNRKKIILHPENPLFDDLECDDIEIQGVAIKVIKTL